jgi:energy-coupling factor transporter ATP-binding protein EcfA2
VGAAVSDEIRPLSSAELARFQRGQAPAIENAWEQDRLPQGVQDDALVALAGWVREHQLWRFSEEGIYHLLLAVTSNGTLDQDPRRPYTERDCRRIARSIAAHPAGDPSFEIKRSRLVWDTPIVGEPADWWLHGFVPKGELVMLYGAKAAGKSTTGSWLSTVVTQAGGTFLHIGVEEPHARFRGRAVIGGAVNSRLAGWVDSFRLPHDVAELEELVTEHRIDFVYFDSIYSHFSAPRGTLENTRARGNLEPLAQMAQRTGATVLGSFHDRRSDGSYMGSTEMVNVARVVLKLTRPRGGSSRLAYEVGNYPEPGYELRLDAEERVLTDPVTGEVQMERQRDGSLKPQKLRVVVAVEEIPEGGTSADLAEAGSVDHGQLARELSNDGLSSADIAGRLQLSVRAVKRFLSS